MTLFRPMIGALVLSALAAIAPAHAAEDDVLPGVFDLPSALPARAIAIIYSGDGGWQDLDKTIGEWMAAKDIHVIGVSTVKAFWETREPEQVAADIEKLIAEADPSGALPVMLIGYSFGANVLPFAWPLLRPDTQSRIRLVALLAPEKETSFHVSVEGWLGIETGSHSVVDAIRALPPDPVLCVFGEDEADDTPCVASTLPGMQIEHTTGGHHFDGDYPKLGQTILNAFAARKPRSPEDLPTTE
jgi:type IV secretory pathway VirJ component